VYCDCGVLLCVGMGYCILGGLCFFDCGLVLSVGMGYRKRGFVYCDRCVLLCVGMDSIYWVVCVLCLWSDVLRQYVLQYIGSLCIVTVVCCCASLWGTEY